MDSIKHDSRTMVFIKENNMIVLPVEPHCYAFFTVEQAERLGFDISKMKHYEKLSLNGSSDGYELIEPDPIPDPTGYW
ncbi:TPA: hypothetical protein N2299_001807 [Enterobacter hormaechei]|uniref:hypothetical protein n=1 Tax=Enterobacter cloacae complex TaxID=354276 RepID=UPI0005F08D8A|nr:MULTISPECIES: hypothetical protein [Enterobacter cloacae complex]CAE6319436.1 hypothetical protein AI2716V1_0359 [Enterobacter cloacae]HDR2757157.1 hypothetical protein [Enterobacter mori]HED3541896.1 hypothetical protein [Enterobacter hormaechei subsp. hormaechei]ELC7278016.1 hypothetical protein [Enterobacter hormaechei]ELD3451329.1 hypothetical protein [Enterobacter hormaechei]